MRTNKRLLDKRTLVATLLLIMFVIPVFFVSRVLAETGLIFTVSPMKEKIVLNPGDEYSSSVEVFIPDKYENDMSYNVEVTPYFVDENYNNDFNNIHGTNSEILKWISFSSPTEGRLSPGEKANIAYTIKVPENAPGGGQYAAIMVTADIWREKNADGDNNFDNEEIGASLKEEKKIAHTIYAEITGDITRQGEIIDINVPGFLLSGDITGMASVKNTGNVHGEVTYKLQVFPLFSNEEVYTNEEDPQDRTILPGRTLYNETVWENTPSIGIFNVLYTAEFEGVTAQISKIVIKCPIWLLFIILFAIAALIIWIVMRVKSSNKKKSRKAATTTE